MAARILRIREGMGLRGATVLAGGRMLKKRNGGLLSVPVVKLKGWQREHRSSVRQTPKRFFDRNPRWPVSGEVSS